jgi:hypothetical protein
MVDVEACWSIVEGSVLTSKRGAADKDASMGCEWLKVVEFELKFVDDDDDDDDDVVVPLF